MAAVGNDIKFARELLEQGQLVAIPTETVYGLGGNALNTKAVSLIYEVKDRPYFDPLIVHVASLEKAHQYIADIPRQAEQLAQRFWPGPLTLLLSKSDVIPDLVTAGLNRVGLRCPDHPMTLSLLEQLPFPLAAPSANPFGYVSPTTAGHVQEQLGNKIPYILDGGSCRIGIESTIVGWDRLEPVVYRMGGVTVEELELTIGRVRLLAQSDSQPQAPGQLKSHYAPRKRFLLGNIEALLQKNQKHRAGILTFQPRIISGITPETHLVLSPSGDLREAASNLFSMLRQFDQMDVDIVLSELVPEAGLGRAINDRLRRAASGNEI